MGKIKLNRPKKKKTAQDKERGQISLEKLRKTLGFPDNTEFLGYAIYLEKSDDFLAEFTDLPNDGVTKKLWARTPQLALCCKTLTKAFKISGECSGSVVVGLFDTGTQIMTVKMSANR
jgi:hypothetical protein